MKARLLILTILSFSIQLVLSQQDDGIVAFDLPLRNSLFFNRYNINPTFTFVREQNKYISFNSKRDWIQFENAPEMFLGSFSGRFSENIGAGIAAFQQNYGVLTTFGGLLNFAYNVKLNTDSNLTFGLNVGAYKSGVNTSNVITNFDDPSLQNVPENFLLTVNPGINYGTEFLDFGISINNLVLYNFETSSMIEDNPKQGIKAHVMHTGYFNSRGFFKDTKLSGILMTEFRKDQTIISGLASLNVPKGIWFQIGYNNHYGVSGGIGINITKNIALEYNIEKSIGELVEFGSSHDVALAYRFITKKKYKYNGDEKVSGLFTKKRTKPIVEATEEELEGIRERAAERRAQAKLNREAEEKAKRDAEANALEKAQQLAKEKAEREAKAKKARLLAEQQAKKEAEAKLLAEQKAKEEAEAKARAQQLVEQKARDEAAEKARLLAEQQAKEEAEAKAKLLAEQKAKAEAEAQARAQQLAEEKAREEAAEKARLLAEQQAKEEAEAKLLAEQKIKEEAEAAEKAKQVVEEKARKEAEKKAKEEVFQREKELAEARIKKRQEELAAQKQAEEAIKNPKDELGKTIANLAKDAETSSTEQKRLIKDLETIVETKDEDLKDLKEENDLSDQGVTVQPKPFKSVTEENNRLNAIKANLNTVIKDQSKKIESLKTLYEERYKTTELDEVNLFYKKKIDRLSLEQKKIVDLREKLDQRLETIKTATEFEKRRRIKRAAYDNEQDRYTQDRAMLKNIKRTTKPSETPYTSEDFDFGQEQSENIQILKNVSNTENGYYLIIAVHSNIKKRNEFLTKVVASGQANVDFFYDVSSSKYYIYQNKFDNISEANKAMEAKGNKAYNVKMTLVKIEN